MSKNTSAFTPDNLHELECYHDFWDAYIKVQQAYEDVYENYHSPNTQWLQIPPWQWDRLAVKQVRKICDPLLVKYSYLFYADPCSIHANAYGFQVFSVLNYTYSSGKYVYSYKSFDEFLTALENSIVRIISRWKNREAPETEFATSRDMVETRIQLLVDSNPTSLQANDDESNIQSEVGTVNHYIAFKQWLIQTGHIKSCPDAVSFAFSINKFMQKRICTINLWEVILKKRYALLYKCRRHPQYQRSQHYAEVREQVFRLCFDYLERSYDAYIQYEAERTISENTKPHIVYLHQGNIACLKYHHPTNDVTASIAVGTETPLRAHATRCWKCNIIFMHKNYYLQLRKQHPFAVANFCEIGENGYSPIVGGQFAAESPLKLCGYNARKDSSLSDEERQEILGTIIENGILTKAEILQYLNHFIGFNGECLQNRFAVTKWESDYHFVADLNIDDHPLVCIDEIRPYSKQRRNTHMEF